MQKFVIIIILMFFSIFETSCSKNDNLDGIPTLEMAKWIQDHSDGAPGWLHVKWDSVTLADVNHITSQKTNEDSQKVVDQLNLRFMKTTSSAPNNLGDYYDTGNLVHGWDSVYDVDPNEIFSPVLDYIATSYIRADVTKALKKPIWNSSFHDYELGSPSAGVIYLGMDTTNSSYSVFCLYPTDANSSDRYKGCNTTESEIQNKLTPDYKSKIDAAWNTNTSINICKESGVNDISTYQKYPKKAPCPLSGSKTDFDLFKSLMPTVLSRSASWVGSDYNEFILRIDRSKYPDMVAGIFYLSSKNSNYYAVPEGDLKKYNIHLGQAQVYQKKLWESKHIFKPIIDIDMDKVVSGQAPFSYNKEDQIVN